mmetsp:Transcript_32353/g.94685  ORF Transcript_32353/g.94685 Transcript_32353/m.94685 type:complete len:103 (+) Transcript_32353:92-400(+)
MFMFHRLLSLVTMMYNEQDELTVCDFVRAKDRQRIQRIQAERRRQQEEDERQEAVAARLPRVAAVSMGAPPLAGSTGVARLPEPSGAPTVVAPPQVDPGHSH